jgi:hypothetical protein
MDNFFQELVVHFPINPDTVVERQGCIEREALKVRVGVDVNLSVCTVSKKLFDAAVRF